MSDIEFYTTLAVQRGERYALKAAVDDLDKLRIEVERLRAERDALREALQDMVDEFQHMARPGRAYINVDDALQAAGILDKANAALAAVPTPPQAGDRLLAVAERAVKGDDS